MVCGTNSNSKTLFIFISFVHNKAPNSTFIQAPAPVQNVVERRERANTVAAPSRQRPVTWMVNNPQVQRVAEEAMSSANGQSNNSGGEIQGAAAPLPTVNALTTIITPSVHMRQATAPPTSFASAADQQQQSAASPSESSKGGVFNTLRQLGRRLSETAGVRNAAQPTNSAEKPRAIRFSFNSSTTSTKAPDDIAREICSALQQLGLKFQSTGRFSVDCTWYFREQPLRQSDGMPARLDVTTLQTAIQEVVAETADAAPSSSAGNDIRDAVRFEIEVCEVPQLRNVHGLRFKRLNGPSSEYKDICGMILQTVKL
jgi:MAP/microtubule affinity-regulating kinase